jgi:PAS domain S-box-containing protein
VPAILLVDDRRENLVAVEAILEPLGHELVPALSGEEALRILLARDDFAVILLDVQMPVLDGFATAALIKERERTAAIPIIFVTAISKEERNVFRGYETGAVDYVFKPFDAEILRAKVSVFVELWEKTAEVRRQTELLALQEVDAVRRENAERYRQLADAMPQIVWTADREGRTTYLNRRWFDYTGLDPEHEDAADWQRIVHPADLPAAAKRRAESLAAGTAFEIEYRFRAGDGTYRWHLGRSVPIHAGDEVDFWIGTATDIDDRKRVEEAQLFLLEAGYRLAGSLDHRAALASVARLAVERVADWCAVDLLEPDGTLTRVAIEHTDPAKALVGRELADRYPVDPDDPVAKAARDGEAAIVRDISDELLEASAVDDAHLELLRELGLRSLIVAPMTVREKTVGVISLVSAESGRRLDESDLRLAQALAQRAGMAVDNARLYEEAERRARAARVLETIADGVVVVDEHDVVLLWNAAAEAITGLRRDDVVGRSAAEVFPAFAPTARLVPVDGSRAETLPVEVNGRELWLSISGVRFEDGTAYAFRDLTEERALEQLRSDFVATVSHELRTPLAAIYGAAVTVRRGDLQLADELRDRLLAVIADESDRLARIVNDILLASHLDSGQLHLSIGTVDAAELTEAVVEAARTHLPETITLALDAPASLPAVAADEQQLRQVFVNLIDNAVKYSPDGGAISVVLRPASGHLRWSVSDQGLGIPPHERRRVFEKFYRLDPNMSHGVGGTGLGLYISRELVRRLEGRIWAEGNEPKGSTFHVEIPLAKTRATRPAREKQTA